MNMNVLRRVTWLVSVVAAGIGTAIACSWTWEQDNCADVHCPTGVCFQTSYDSPQSNCYFVNQLECCNCWYRRRRCYLINNPSVECERQVPPAPNIAFWDCWRETTNGECVNVPGWGKKCLGAGECPFPDEGAG